jgi:hypothetical protein
MVSELRITVYSKYIGQPSIFYFYYGYYFSFRTTEGNLYQRFFMREKTESH